MSVARYAIDKHDSVNQKYGEYSYSLHLKMVAGVAMRYKYLIKIPTGSENHSINHTVEAIITACYCHDIMEDARVTYNDLLEVFRRSENSGFFYNYLAADIVYAVTNEKGKNRKERANDKYYEGIRNQEFATFVKLCDRIANSMFSKNMNQNKFNGYVKEHPEFVKRVASDEDRILYKDMFDELDSIIGK